MAINNTLELVHLTHHTNKQKTCIDFFLESKDRLQGFNIMLLNFPFCLHTE
jgi:hypothetical protein